jgi:hypothetical protein
MGYFKCIVMLCMIDRKSEKRFTQKAWDKIQRSSILTLKICEYGGIFFIILMIKDFFNKVKESESFFRRH